MTDFLHRVAIDWHKTLERVVALAGQAGRDGLLVFDLDSTVFDNRPRQARIVREWAQARGLARVAQCQAFHFVSGWDLRGALVRCGLSPDEAEGHAGDLKAFWQERFFTSEYCQDDVEVVGAPRYLHSLVGARARIVYVTGRHEAMRAGTVACLAKCAMPTPSADGHVELLMKPTLRESDDAYKRQAHLQLAAMGTVLAAFDNEPMHINDYAVKFASALPIHLATDHSGRPVSLHERVISVPHFAW